MDKELSEMGYAGESILKLRKLLDGCGTDASGVKAFAAAIGTETAMNAGENVSDIMDSVTGFKGRNIRLKFDPTLVRGMGYYTGTIFEIKTDALGSSVGGGGRYDRMVGRFIGQDTPAVGFSIGFERIMSILMEDGSGLIKNEDKSAWLIEKGMPEDRLKEIFNEAGEKRSEGRRILMVWMAKNKKFQKEGLTAQGYTEIREFYINELKH